ncbi:MAG TPA: hypothetical protein VNE17_07465 [Nitrolancea sp.]|nr:hypothetical protein [Nitrolancea sp.]
MVLVGFMAVYALFVGILYGRQRRWWGASGWVLLVGGIVALSAGLGDAFAWGGLAFIGVSAVGGLCIALDLAARRERPMRD